MFYAFVSANCMDPIATSWFQDDEEGMRVRDCFADFSARNDIFKSSLPTFY